MRLISTPLAQRIIEEIAPLLSRQRGAWAARCHARGVSITHLQVVTVLEDEGQVSMSRLAEILDVSLPSVTGIVDRMAERGLVERVADPSDRRVVLARLTAAGAELGAELERLRLDRLGAVVQRLTEAQQANLLQAVRDLSAAFAAETASNPDNVKEH
ncbi:MAG: MarR family transcriptional regulator [Chloroflexota bacterium]|nr:MarR family transcriptional regulator [Chloroflexota bacterium]